MTYFNFSSSFLDSYYNHLKYISNWITVYQFGGFRDDHIGGTFFKDKIFGLWGDDTIYGLFGDDYLNGGSGNDTLIGGRGNDVLVGGKGADTFVFNPAKSFEGHDVIKDFKLGEDSISLDLGDILRVDPLVILNTANLNGLDFSDLDADSDWNVSASDNGDVMITHPSGTIELAGVGFEETTDTFVELASAIEITTDKLILGTDNADTLTGTFKSDVLFAARGDDYLDGGAGDDILVADGGNDTLVGGSGDDLLFGGTGTNRYKFDPTNEKEGNDVIELFSFGNDKVVLQLEDILESTPGIEAASGDPNALELSDLDAVEEWQIVASEDDNLLIKHPGGTIELNSLPFITAADTFTEITAAIEIQSGNVI